MAHGTQPGECMQECIGVQEGSSYKYCGGFHLSLSLFRRWCFGLRSLPFLLKEGTQTRHMGTQTQMKHLMACWDDEVKGFSEDMQSIRDAGGSERQSRSLMQFENVCSRMRVMFHLRRV